VPEVLVFGRSSLYLRHVRVNISAELNGYAPLLSMVLTGREGRFPKIKSGLHIRTMTRRDLVRLLVLFGTVYFVQGIVEPTGCLPAQPVQSQLRMWGFSADQVGRFFGIMGIGWSLKPLIGVISDFFPIAGFRRWPYLVVSLAATVAAFSALAAWWAPPSSGAFGRIGWLLVGATVGVAMTDVVIDALAVETGQPLGLTGQIQAVQWFALSVAGLVAGSLGGLIAQRDLQTTMFIGCAGLVLGSFVILLLAGREQRHETGPRDTLRTAFRQLLDGQRAAALLIAAAFLFLWNFNPFSSNVLQEYVTKELHLSEQFYGHMLSMQSVGMIVGCVAYWQYCRRVTTRLLVHGSIVAGIVSSLGYWLVHDRPTALAASFLYGLAWQTGTLVQLDLSARICPTQAAGTMFALLMAIGNSGSTVGVYFGGGWYDHLVAAFSGDESVAFHTLAGIAATFTSGCWLLMPLMKRAGMMGD